MESTQTNFINVKRISSWGKFLAVMTYIGSGFYVIYGLYMLLFALTSDMGFGLALLQAVLLFLPITVTLFYLGRYLWRLAKVAESLAKDDRQYDVNDLFYNLGKYLRLSGIMIIVSFVLSFVFGLLAFILFASAYGML